MPSAAKALFVGDAKGAAPGPAAGEKVWHETTAHPVLEEGAPPPFVAASTFQGPRMGYTFKSGPLGMGYYRSMSIVRIKHGGLSAVLVGLLQLLGCAVKGD